MGNPIHPKHRPINLNLIAFRFPLTAIVSILHRLSGVFIFFMLPFLLKIFSLSLASPDDFLKIQFYFHSLFFKLLLWVILSAFFYHFMAGLRHFMMDLGKGETLQGARLSAYAILVMTLLFAACLGIVLGRG